MKKISLCIIFVIYIFSFTNCTGGGDKKGSEDSTGIKKTDSNSLDTTKKHLVFFSDSILGEIKEKQDKYFKLLANFKPVPHDKFDAYHDDFKTFFKINTPAPIISNFDAPSFFIYDKYNSFQSDFTIQFDMEFKPATGTDPAKLFKNRIRIYPAINPGNEFYLLIMSEKQDMLSTSVTDPETNLTRYYTIKPNGSVPVASTTQAETDIRKFQTVWLNTVAPLYPQYIFDSTRSFTYSIEEYDELLSNATGYWNWRQYQSNQSPKEMVKVFPIIVTDDPSYPSHALFKLVFVPYNQRLLGGYRRDNTRGFFDNMDVCPEKCPLNDIQ